MSNSWGKPKKLEFNYVDEWGGISTQEKIVRWTYQGSVDILHIDELPSMDFNERKGETIISFQIDTAQSIYEVLKDYFEKEEYDPTPYCSGCNAHYKKDCNCGPIADNE